MAAKVTYSLHEICEELYANESLVIQYIERKWIQPPAENAKLFDEEDLERLRLILELKNDFEVNDEGVEIILHLLDQLYSLRMRAKVHGRSSEK